jgi:hypothetical protein
LFPNIPPAVPAAAGVEEDVAAALVAAPPKSPPLVVVVVVVVEAGVTDPRGAAGFAPKRELADPAVAVAVAAPGVIEVAGVLLAAAPPKRPPVGVPVTGAGLLPKSPLAEEPAPDCAPPKSPEAGGATDGAAEGAVFAPPPKSPPAEVVAVAAGLDGSAGGAPAGVVDGSENIGLAGVVAEAAVGVVPCGAVVGVAPALLPKRDIPEFAKRPAEGAALVVVML